MTERRPLSVALRVSLGVGLVLAGIGAAVAVRAFARRPDRRTVVLLESLQERARATWKGSTRPRAFVFPHVVRSLDHEVQWDDLAHSGKINERGPDEKLPDWAVRDRWGKAIRVQIPGVVHTLGYDLWSCGPNGIDEKGKGDDLLVGEDLETEAEYTKEVLDVVAARIREMRTPPLAKEDPADPTGLWALSGRGRKIEYLGAGEPPPESPEDVMLSCGSHELVPASDGWGRGVHYRCPGPVHRKGWDLYSLGPNGLDDHGQGDDILVGEDLAPGR